MFDWAVYQSNLPLEHESLLGERTHSSVLTTSAALLSERAHLRPADAIPRP